MGDHTETVRVEYDPEQIGYDQLLALFLKLHSPTAKSFRRQYRNAVFYLDEEQKQLIDASVIQLQETLGKEVKTDIEPAGVFTEAEDYHQKYYLRSADGLIEGLRHQFPDEKSLIVSTAAARLNGFLGCHGDPETLAEDIAALGLTKQAQMNLQEYLTLRCMEFRGVPCALPQ